MLTALNIKDVVLIEELAIAFAPGLNVFTGETGAGKSILLDALGLALGARSDAGLVRQGAAQATVSAAFELAQQHPIFALAAEQGLDLENPVIVRRIVGKDGKSRAFLNDQPISISLLKQCGDLMLEVHGQFETYGLLNPAAHRDLLDAFAGAVKHKREVAGFFTAWREAQKQLEEALSMRDRAQSETAFLQSAVSELDNLDPQAGEAEQLAAKRTVLQNREKILSAAEGADGALNSERGALTLLTNAGKSIAKVVERCEEMRPLLAALDRALNEAAEAAAELDRFTRQIDNDPSALQTLEDRLFALRSVARKHNVQVDELPDLRGKLTARLDLLTGNGEGLKKLEQQSQMARAHYVAAAQKLGEVRRDAAKKLQANVMKELPPLKFECAQFVVEVTTLDEHQWSAEGMDQVTFTAATNPGAAAGPIHKIASGGELSRFMLALKVVMAGASPAPTLVFDEIDAGIGGATASAVGERLARLAGHIQLLVITHSPQVAARATEHLRVSKSLNGDRAFTTVEQLSSPERHEEIARMLAGTEVTEAARQAALSLMQDGLKDFTDESRTPSVPTRTRGQVPFKTRARE